MCALRRTPGLALCAEHVIACVILVANWLTCHISAVCLQLAQSSVAAAPLCEGMDEDDEDRLHLQREHATLINMLHDLGEGSASDTATVTTIPVKGPPTIPVKGPPTKAAEPLIQRVEDQTKGVEPLIQRVEAVDSDVDSAEASGIPPWRHWREQQRAQNARDPLDPVGAPKVFGPPLLLGVAFAPPPSCQVMPCQPKGPRAAPAAKAVPVFGQPFAWDEVQRRLNGHLLSGPTTQATPMTPQAAVQIRVPKPPSGPPPKALLSQQLAAVAPPPAPPEPKTKAAPADIPEPPHPKTRRRTGGPSGGRNAWWHEERRAAERAGPEALAAFYFAVPHPSNPKPLQPGTVEWQARRAAWTATWASPRWEGNWWWQY